MSQARAWLAVEYNLSESTAAQLYDTYAAVAPPRAAAGASAAYVAAEWAETDQSMFCGARRAARHASIVRAPPAFLYRFARGVGGAAWSHHRCAISPHLPASPKAPDLHSRSLTFGVGRAA